MTDKVQEIREEIKKRLKGERFLSSDKEYNYLLSFIDSLQEEPSIPEIVDEHYWEMLGEEPVSEFWHDASKEPNDMSHCLIFYGDKNDVGHYLHYEPVLYNHQEKVFVTESFPHPTGYKVEQKSIDGGCVTEVYKNKRDRISISDITQWCYLKDLHNLSNVERTVKDWKEEPIIEVLDRYLDRVPDEEVLKTKIAINEWFNVYFPKLQEEPVNDDLKEAANNALEGLLDKYDLVGTGSCLEMFKLGAKWGKNQAKAEIQAQSMALAHGCPKEEPVSIWHDASEKPNIKEKGDIFVITSSNGKYIGSRYYSHNDVTINFGNYDKWAYLNDLLNLSNVQRIVKDWKKPVSEELEQAAVEAFKKIVDDGRNSFLEIFKAGAEWQLNKIRKEHEENRD